MTVVRRSSLFSFLFFCFHLLAPLLWRTSDAQSSAMIEAISCSNTGNYTPSGAYAANLNQFLAALPQNAVSKNGGFFSGTVGEGTATVYGLAMCSADHSRADCGDCLAATVGSNTGGLPKRCPGSTTVLAVFDKCLVRYSDTNFLGTAETDIIYSSGGAAPSSSRMEFSGKMKDRLALLTGEAVSSPQRFAASGVDPPYALMQCSWDLPPDKCKQCLEVLSANASDWFTITIEGKRKSYSCTLRYSNTSFTVVPFSGASSGPLLPTSSSDDQTTTSRTQSSRTVAMVIGLVVALIAAALLVGWFWHRRYRSRRQHKTQEDNEKPTDQIPVTTPGTSNAATTPSTSNGTMGQGEATTTPSGATTNKGNGQQVDSKVDSPRSFPYAELAQATNNFDRKKELGRGAFGVVYKGTLPGTDVVVAIKEMRDASSDQAKKAFHNEITIMSLLHHRNILRLKGWCDEDKHLLLMYEIMENGNLEDHLYPKNGTMDSGVYGAYSVTNNDTSSSHLGWPRRCNILLGIASGLAYLHKECPDDAIVHRDIKPANVMLDKNFNAKLADFGLVTQVRHTQTSRPTDTIIGTRSYIDPAYVDNGKVCGQCDVYSLGVVLLEIVCGKKPIILDDGNNNLIKEVTECDSKNRILDAADQWLMGPFNKEIEDVLQLGLKCVRPDRHNRPHTGRVRDYLTELLVDRTASVASTSQNRQPGEEEYGTCVVSFSIDSPADEEAGISPLLEKKKKDVAIVNLKAFTTEATSLPTRKLLPHSS